ncbi:GNAT family N-acetyltransferase [Endozoicomonas sp. (ex Bugula neritina AB1)]|nr:GNAT family N-acetyltransferase [Endozoicomonas sp. (ex Bugula neritina AB1)]
MAVEALLIDYHNPRQAADLVELLSHYAKDPMGGGEELPLQIKEELIPALQSRSHAFSIICYVDGVAAGLANCFEGFSTFKCKSLINIHDFVVLDTYRGKGLSQQLMLKVEEVAQQRECCKITLEVLEGNHTAQRAYTRFGFENYNLDPAMGNAMLWQKYL